MLLPWIDAARGSEGLRWALRILISSASITFPLAFSWRPQAGHGEPGACPRVTDSWRYTAGHGFNHVGMGAPSRRAAIRRARRGRMMLQSRMGVFLVTGVIVALLTACGAKAPESAVASPASADGAANPFLTPSPLPYGLPPFDQIEHAHFAPAFAAGMAEERAQVEAILANSGAPSFENTIVALEMTGSTLDRVSRVFMPFPAPIRTTTFRPFAPTWRPSWQRTGTPSC